MFAVDILFTEAFGTLLFTAKGAVPIVFSTS